jgi:DNA-binding transcriptional ArsR family regulator
MVGWSALCSRGPLLTLGSPRYPAPSQLDKHNVRDYFRKMSLTNPFGDFEVTDPQAMRALAHPVRLGVLSHLQRHGPATATQLADVVGASPSVTSWHLRHLAKFGLVKDWDGGTDARERWWQAAARGFRFELPAGPEGTAAFRQLSGQLFDTALMQARHWITEVEPHLEPGWLAHAGVSNTGLVVTEEELAQIEKGIDEVLAPFVTRAGTEGNAEARGVRLLRFFMPAAGPESGSE